MLNFLLTAEQLTRCKELSPQTNRLIAIIDLLDLHHSSVRDEYALGINIIRSNKHIAIKDGTLVPSVTNDVSTSRDLLDHMQERKRFIKTADHHIALINNACADPNLEAYVLIGICKDNVFGKYVDLIVVDHPHKDSAGSYHVMINNYLFDKYVEEYGDGDEIDTVSRIIVDLLDLLGKNTSNTQQ